MNIVQIYQKYPSKLACLKHLESVRWRGVVKCPYCAATRITQMKGDFRYHCNNCNTSFSVTVKTIFHNTKLDLQKWFLAIALILNAKKGLSARQLGRDLECTKDTAWFMAMRIRKSMLDQGELLKGIVEMDETYIGGKPRKIGQSKRGRGTNKTPVAGMMERSGRVKAYLTQILTSKRLMSLVRKNVNTEKSILMTDELSAYNRMEGILPHFTINHSKEYVRDDFHTNSIEGFWALLKRGIVGQYHKVSIGYLQAYINEFSYRFNNRQEFQSFRAHHFKSSGGIT